MRVQEKARKPALDARGEIPSVFPPLVALIVYRLGQEILILQSGVRFPVGAPISWVVDSLPDGNQTTEVYACPTGCR